MNKEVILTGAGKGLGFSIAKLHLQAGDRVWALEYSVTPALQALSESYPDLLRIRPCDVRDTESIRNALSPCLTEQTKIDIIYCVAGIYYFSDKVPLDQTNWQDAMELYSVNALGPMRVLAVAQPLLHNKSVVMTITSEAGSIGATQRQAEYGYCMSKAAANMGMKIFSNATRELGVRSFCIHPGWLKTDMGGDEAQKSPHAITPEESAEALFAITADPQLIPEDIMYLDNKRTPLPW